MCQLCLIYSISLIFISVQKDIMVCTDINKLIFFSNVIKSVRPTYGNKEELAPLSIVLTALNTLCTHCVDEQVALTYGKIHCSVI